MVEMEDQCFVSGRDRNFSVACPEGPTQSHIQRMVILSLGEGGKEREAENSANTSLTWCGTVPPPPHGNRNRLHVQFQGKLLLTLRHRIEIGARTLHIYRDFTHSLLRRSKIH
jgi:hypothetical protein